MPLRVQEMCTYSTPLAEGANSISELSVVIALLLHHGNWKYSLSYNRILYTIQIRYIPSLC